MDEFALCWNNFADNIASGFQNLYDRGDLVDVTIACDGKLLKAHKIVLAICSPYFQEMFLENPCKHPIIVLKDVAVNVMQELLQFMYQGEVNVKHSELQSFMKIAETLQIKGLTASHRNDRSSSSAAASPATHHQPQPAHSNNASTNRPSTSQLDPSKLNSYLAAAAKESLKRVAEFPSSEQYPIHYPKKPLKRSTDSIDQESNSDCMDQLSSDEVFIPASPQVSMIEPGSTPSRQFDLSSVKRENTNDSSCSPQQNHPHQQQQQPQQSPTNLATSAAASMKLGFSSTPTTAHGHGHHGHHSGLHPMFGAFDPSGASFSGIASSLASISGAAGVAVSAAGGSVGGKVDYSNSQDYSADFGKGGVPPGHMDIPAGPSVTMLSSTSLLHHNCIFNRNNTVATQQGLKTYWLCKSYRVSMCRARCITHHGQVISSTGVHNHPPHMKGPHEFSQQPPAIPPVPPPPPVPPMTSGNQNLGLQNHPEHQNHHIQLSPPPVPPAMVTSNGTYDHPPPQHYHQPMGPPHDQYSQHHYPQDPYYPQVPPMVPPPLQPMLQNGQPAEVPDVKLIQLQPVQPMDESLGRTVANAIGATETDSILLPPPPQPPCAAPAALQLKTEQIS